MLQIQQAHQGSDRDRGTAQPGGEVGAPRGDEAFVVEVGVDAGELVGQAPGLKGEQVVPGSDRWGGNAKHHKLLKHPEAPSNAILPGHHHCPAASSLLKAYDRLHFLRSKGPGEGRGPEWIADGYAVAGLGRGLGVTAGPAVLTYG